LQKTSLVEEHRGPIEKRIRYSFAVLLVGVVIVTWCFVGSVSIRLIVGVPATAVRYLLWVADAKANGKHASHLTVECFVSVRP